MFLMNHLIYNLGNRKHTPPSYPVFSYARISGLKIRIGWSVIGVFDWSFPCHQQLMHARLHILAPTPLSSSDATPSCLSPPKWIISFTTTRPSLAATYSSRWMVIKSDISIWPKITNSIICFFRAGCNDSGVVLLSRSFLFPSEKP